MCIRDRQKGTYLQLGAFSNADNAENLKNRLASELEWLLEPLRVYPAGGIHRLQLGPYPNREAAERVAERILSLIHIWGDLRISRKNWNGAGVFAQRGQV